MLRRSRMNYAIVLLISDLCLTLSALRLASLARLHLPFGLEPSLPQVAYLPPSVYVIVAMLWPVMFSLMSVYDSRKNERLVDELEKILVGTSMATLVFGGALYLSFRDVSRLLFIYFFIFDLVALVGFRLLMSLIFLLRGGKAESTTRVLVIGAGKVGQEVARTIRERERPGPHAIGYLDDDPEKRGTRPEGLPVLGTLTEASQVVQDEEVDEVILALPLRAHRKMVSLVTELASLPVDVKVVPDFFDLAFHHASIDRLGGIPLIGLREPAIGSFQRMIKRIFDLMGAVLLLVFLSPLMFILGILVRLDSKGPAIFRQERVGENCEKISIYKFRSMVEGADGQLGDVVEQTEEGHIVYKRKDDPRITRVGRFLRRFSLDELPQLLNVIRGEMSLVGPRPELPLLVEQYEPWQLKRFAVPPGMTGWWQISGRSDRPMHLHVEDDLYYIQNYSLLLDLQIICKTIGVVLRAKGAY